MLRYTDSSLHKPLCRLEVASSDKKEQARLGKEVAGQFKNLLGWQGIKKARYPEQLTLTLTLPLPLTLPLTLTRRATRSSSPRSGCATARPTR